MKLADCAGLYNRMSPEQQSFIKELNPMNVEARYPEYKEQIAAGLCKDECGRILKGAEALLCWTKQQL